MDYKYAHQTANFFKKLRDLLYEKGMKENSLKAQWETDFFNFQLIDGNCKPIWSGMQKVGKMVCF